jgi:hypothetical protein
MISIFTTAAIKNLYFKDFSFDGIDFVDSKSKADFSIISMSFDNINSEFFKNNSKTICIMQSIKHKKRVNIRKGYCVDNRVDIPKFKNFCFSFNDFCNIPYIIPMPGGPTPNKVVSQKPKYWLDYNIKNTDFHNKVYWCSRTSTHESRKPFMKFYNSINDPRFDVSEFKFNVYATDTDPSIFNNHIEKLSRSDISFILRGDKTFANSFFDVIMAGCIPVMISSMNYYGWENIFENVDDYMLRFDLREHSMEYIHEQVVLLLEDKERVLRMKANIANFYNTFFRHSAQFGFGEFLLAKCIEIYKNDFDLEKIDDKFICSEILTLKGLKGKL